MPTTLERRKHHTSKTKLGGIHVTKGKVDGIFTTVKEPSATVIFEAKHHLTKKEIEAAATIRKMRAQMAELEKRLGVSGHTGAVKVILPELHDKASGRIDAQKVANFISVQLKSLSEGLGLNYKALHRNPSGTSFQGALRPVKRVLEYLYESFRKPEIVRAWLNTPHPMLENKSSLETILEGKAFAVERLLGNAWDGVVS